MPEWLVAAGWGLLGGAALLIGAAVAWFVKVPRAAIAGVMAFGAGVLISALAFDLGAEAAATGGLWATAAGFLVGSALYVAANAVLARRGARHRKRSGALQATEAATAGSGTAIAVGALLDGVPESVVLGLSLLDGSGVSAAFIVAVFLSNLPEGLSSAAGMKAGGRSARYVFGVWSLIAVTCAVAAGLGHLVLGDADPRTIAVITAVAAGAILTMIADTMIPEAFERAHDLTGFITTAGFLTAFAISRSGG
ncbi:MAG: Zinc/iron permease [Actinotalea sp.]|jgi:ZIP family zinc transporter|nr:Zinc/iron permease [Actinotalea sp.]